MLLMLKSVLKQRVNIQFCILNESSATLSEGLLVKALTEGLPMIDPSSRQMASDDGQILRKSTESLNDQRPMTSDQ